MSIVGSLIETSLLQSAQAQQVASTKRGREQREVSDRAQRYRDQVDLKVAGVEAVDPIRPLPDNTSEQQHEEERGHAHRKPGDDEHVHIDVQA